ncbi:MAG: hypothetical protein PF442_07860 [Desulfobulbaceae bacterium]|jgi:hypothetical protein|nr:hypothetical protein [Desulfobulbaceae bacterium]
MQETSINNLAKANEKKQLMKDLGITPERLDPAEKARRNPNSRRQAIYAKCWDCCCEQSKEIRLCPSVDCSLFRFRPYQPQKRE